MNKIVGYARVSTEEQNLNLQIDALISAGCNRKNIYSDKVSGSKENRPGLNMCMEALQSGDTLMVWRLDRLGRSMPHLIKLVEDLRENDISFKSICDGVIDTTSASGELVFNIFSSLAQFEKSLVQERTRAGLKAARARGKNGGRQPITSDDPKVLTAKKMHKDHSLSIDDICKILKISRATFYRYLALKDNKK
jgi:DNA invertase Pin-like site-specific DNA recombinase